MKQTIKTAIMFLIGVSLICGILYPLFITFLAQVFFYEKANGSIIKIEDKKVGSVLIGQEFTQDKYFWGRMSASEYTKSKARNRKANDIQLKGEQEERKKYLEETSKNKKEVPKDLITYSASGLDPNITEKAAYFQVERISKARGISKEEIEGSIKESLQNTSDPKIKMVNVLKLNIELDKRFK